MKTITLTQQPSPQYLPKDDSPLEILKSKYWIFGNRWLEYCGIKEPEDLKIDLFDAIAFHWRSQFSTYNCPEDFKIFAPAVSFPKWIETELLEDQKEEIREWHKDYIEQNKKLWANQAKPGFQIPKSWNEELIEDLQEKDFEDLAYWEIQYLSAYQGIYDQPTYPCPYGNLQTFETGGAEFWWALNDEEADKAAKEYCLETVWAFNSDFLSAHIKALGSTEIRAIQEKLCEGANEALLKLLDDREHFAEDAIKCDGREHFLASYDGEERYIPWVGYFYRVN